MPGKKTRYQNSAELYAKIFYSEKILCENYQLCVKKEKKNKLNFSLHYRRNKNFLRGDADRLKGRENLRGEGASNLWGKGSMDMFP